MPLRLPASKINNLLAIKIGTMFKLYLYQLLLPLRYGLFDIPL